MCHLLVFSLLLLLPLALCQGDDQCTVPSGKDSCVCDTGDGIIDLTSMSFSDGNAFFQEEGPNGYLFSYNPCHSFNTGFSDCRSGSVGICQDYGGGADAVCGTSDSEKIVKRDSDYYVLYSEGLDGRASEVKLICDPTAEQPSLVAYGNGDSHLLYKFDLTTKCACPGTCVDSTEPPDPNDPTGPGRGGSGDGIPIGEIGFGIVGLFIIVLVVYFIVGGILLRFKFEKTGTKIIPQKALWLDLPFLVKDGCLFTLSPLIKLAKRERGVPYDNI